MSDRAHVLLGASKHVHALQGGKTLCGLSTLYAASVQKTARAVDCPECRRVLSRAEPEQVEIGG